jgi:hypothetical protein
MLIGNCTIKFTYNTHMKKHFYIPVLLLFSAGVTRAQNIEQVITKAYVSRIVKTLSSDDMQGRRTFSPGIDKAATFISGEFKEIGLQPLPGETDYRQTFYKYQLLPLSTKVSIDGQTVPSSNLLVLGNTAPLLTSITPTVTAGPP